MSKSYTVTLNNNVVDKLLDIVDGAPKIIVTMEEFNQAVAEGSYVDCTKLKTFLQSKSVPLDSAYNVAITGLFKDNCSTVFGQDAYYTGDYTYIGDILDNLSSDIEAVTYSEYSGGFDLNLSVFPGSDYSGVYASNSDYLILALYYDDGQGYHIEFLTLDDIVSVLSVSQE